MERLPRSKLFRSRRIAKWFPIGVFTSFIFGIVAVPIVLGTSNIAITLLDGLVLGLIGSIALFFVLKLRERQIKRWRSR